MQMTLNLHFPISENATQFFVELQGGGGGVMSVFDWMTQTKLNPSKTEFLLIGCEFQRQKF